MSDQEEKISNTGVMTSNLGSTDSSVLEIRLNTKQLLDRIHHYLKGTRVVIQMDEEGNPVYIEENIGLPKANPAGIHSIMAWLESTINTQVVQGNFSSVDNELDNYLYSYRLDFAYYIMGNLPAWEIKESDFEGIIDMVMIQVRPFMSRLVDNKERDSYSQTIKHNESSNT